MTKKRRATPSSLCGGSVEWYVRMARVSIIANPVVVTAARRVFTAQNTWIIIESGMGQRGSKKARAYENLKRRIISVELSPGLPINEADLATQLGISKTPVREALRQLERDGLVENVPSHGSTISHITLRDINEIFEIREIIEAGAAKRAAAIRGNDELARQRDALAGMIQNPPADAETEYQWGKWEDLHLLLVRSLGNSLLVDVYTGLVDRILRIRNHYGKRLTSGRFGDMVAEHKAILDAVLGGDPDGAENAMVIHLRNASTYLAELAVTGGPFPRRPLPSTGGR